MTDYSKLKVAELKDLVKERGIASTGLKVKQQYVDALTADDEKSGGEAPDEQQIGEEDNAEAADEQQTEEKDDGQAVAEAAVEEPKADVAMEDTEGDDVERSAEMSEEPTNKRKRRSPTPPLSEESVAKKIKTAEEKGDDGGVAKLPEDTATAAPAQADKESDVQNTPIPPAASDDPMDVQKDEGKSQQDSDLRPGDSTSPASKHPVTRALYIRGLVRPLQPQVLRERLLSLAQAATDAAIEEFHLDKLRTHAFVLFDSVSAAQAVRGQMHDKVWPDEPMRKPLWVDFIPEDKVREWTDAEVNRGDLTRWEVVYNSSGPDTDGPIVASLQEAETGASNVRNLTRQPTGTGEGMPTVPSAPKGQPAQYISPPRQSKTNDILDEMYPFTQTKPKIYYQPVPRDLVERRLEEFEKEKSRDWDDRFADPAAYAEGEMRRYTFEDGDRLVDGGADFGLFGRNSRGGMRGAGRGRGRGGDRYRGGGRR